MQLLLLLLSEPNLIILDEPTNDVDADMLAAMEDLLDSWPGTLIVVSHDRYLLERVTDQQYAILDGDFRHLPGGVDEYLRRSSEGGKTSPASVASETEKSNQEARGLSGAEERAARKELSALERRLQRLSQEIEKIHSRMAAHDHSDYAGLGKLTEELQATQKQAEEVEERWFELTEILD